MASGSRADKVKFLMTHYVSKAIEVAAALFFAFLATALVAILYSWATDRGLAPHLHFGKKRTVLYLVAGLFVAIDLCGYWYLVGPDWIVGRRLRHVARALDLELRSNAEFFVMEWVLAQLAKAKVFLSIWFPGRCWALSSAAHPGILLTFTHVPKVETFAQLGGERRREHVAIRLLWKTRPNDRNAGMPSAVTEQLSALGFEVEQMPDGWYVHESSVSRWKRGERAIDKAAPDRLVALWRLCAH